MKKGFVKKGALTLAAFLAVSVLGGLLAILWTGLHDDLRPADVALIPGNTVDSQGNVSARLKARLDRSIELYHAGAFHLFIVSGGTGKEGFPEGTAMERFLVSQGVPAEAIIVDNLGITTHASAVNTKKILEERNLHSVMVVTQYFHILRSRLALKKAGVSDVSSAHAYFWEWRDVYSLLRELPACVKYAAL